MNVLGQSTPYQACYGKKPSIAHLWVFWSICYVHIPKENRKKLDEKSFKCIFVWYSNDSKKYQCYDPVAKKLHASRDVIFNEGEAYIKNSPTGEGVGICSQLDDLTPNETIEYS